MISKWHSSIVDKTVSTVRYYTNKTVIASLAFDTFCIATPAFVLRGIYLLLNYVNYSSYSPLSLSIRDDLIPDFPVQGYISGQG